LFSGFLDERDPNSSCFPIFSISVTLTQLFSDFFYERDPNLTCFPILRILSRLRDTTLSVTLTRVVFRFFLLA
jgi:hypothetical protein